MSLGDKIAVSGIVAGKGKNSLMPYIKANSIQNMVSSKLDSAGGGATSRIQFNSKDLELFEEIKNNNDPFRLLVNSLCPSIFGHELVKAGLILGLFGGCNKVSEINP